MSSSETEIFPRNSSSWSPTSPAISPPRPPVCADDPAAECTVSTLEPLPQLVPPVGEEDSALEALPVKEEPLENEARALDPVPVKEEGKDLEVEGQGDSECLPDREPELEEAAQGDEERVAPGKPCPCLDTAPAQIFSFRVST